MKRWLSLFCALIGLFFYSSWVAAWLDLELTQGVGAPISLAVVGFSGTSVSVSGGMGLPQLVSQDLSHSGEFRIKGPEDVSVGAATADRDFWKSQKLDNVLTGQVESVGGDQYRISIKLVNVFSDTNRPLLEGAWVTDQAGLRRLAHHISDVVYEQLTGSRGIFSTKIAYVLVQKHSGTPTKYRLEISDADGFNPQTLLVSEEPIMSPAWSPDGKRLAYVSFEGHRSTVFIQSVQSGTRQAVSRLPGINGAPTFSPDGNQLAVVLTKTENPNLYLINLGSGSVKTITNSWSIDTEPEFSPDGSALLFTSNRDGGPQIYKYILSSGAVSRVTYDGDYNARASFLPDGKSIVMMHRDDGLFSIAKQELDSGRLQVLTEAGLDESPSVAPNGKMIIYATQYHGRGMLAQVSMDGRVKLRLPAQEGEVQEPAWSPYL